MKKVTVRDLFFELSDETNGVRLKWLSVVESEPNNRVFANVTVRNGNVFCHNQIAINVYGKERTIPNLGKYEWVRKFSIRKSLLGPVLDLESYI